MVRRVQSLEGNLRDRQRNNPAPQELRQAEEELDLGREDLARSNRTVNNLERLAKTFSEELQGALSTLRRIATTVSEYVVKGVERARPVIEQVTQRLAEQAFEKFMEYISRRAGL